MEFDLIALGETMVALAPPPGESLRDADRWLVDHAGAESNTCVGLARLGLRAAWVSALGRDAAGDRILDALEAEQVDTTWVRRDAVRPTGVMLKDPAAGVRYYRTGSAASAMGPDVLDGVPVRHARAVLVTGVTALIGAAPHAAGLALLDAGRGLRIVDPNLRHGLWGSDRRADLVRPFIERCTLLLSGAAELEAILPPPAGAARAGDAPRGALEALARRAVALAHHDPLEQRAREVVVRGTAAIGAVADGVWTEVAIARGAAVDPIGAGDAFNAGYIAARLRGDGVEAALRAGIECGTAVTTAMSDTKGFPRTRA